MVEQQLAPLYCSPVCGRHPARDENGARFRSTTDLWNGCSHDPAANWAGSGPQSTSRSAFSPPISATARSVCQRQNKVFILAGAPGKTLVDAIAHQIHARAAEWRAMPRLPRSAAQPRAPDLLAATQSDNEAADNLRKADALTMRRAGFAIKLRDFEAYERDLPTEAWQAHRCAFSVPLFSTCWCPAVFDLAVYLPQVIRLATAWRTLTHCAKSCGQLSKSVPS